MSWFKRTPKPIPLTVREYELVCKRLVPLEAEVYEMRKQLSNLGVNTGKIFNEIGELSTTSQRVDRLYLIVNAWTQEFEKLLDPLHPDQARRLLQRLLAAKD